MIQGKHQENKQNINQRQKVLRLGTRKSALAMIQTRLAEAAIREKFPEIQVEIVPMVTTGDRLFKTPLSEFGGKGVFVSEFEEAILNGTIDAAVHSAKDLPMELLPGLTLAAALERGEPQDVLVTVKAEREVSGKEMEREGTGDSRKDRPLVVGTGSARRRAQIAAMRNVTCKDLRGNVDTRLQKLYDGQYDAVILAAAGLSRLGAFEDPRFSFESLSPREFLPAGGQGIIALEARSDSDFSYVFQTVNHGPSMVSLLAEREALRLLGSGCHEPVGVFSWEEEGRFFLKLMVEKKDGLKYYETDGEPEECLQLAKILVEKAEEDRDDGADGTA